MDYYNFGPKGSDSIQLLYGPPLARRNCEGSSNKVIPQNNGLDSVEFLYGPPPLTRRNCADSSHKLIPQYRSPFKNVFVRAGPPSQHRGPDIPLATSLILQKETTRREISEKKIWDNHQYAYYANTTIPRHHVQKIRPIIKVTVIPNNTPQPRKRRSHIQKAKRAQSSVSNREIHAKNVNLLLDGKSKDNIYHLKSSGSADISLNAYNFTHYVRHDAIVEHNITQLLNSLNMDKKKKGKRKKEEEKRKEGDESENSEDCGCEVNPRKSRVRIVGRIGLTEDDRYVLKCAATVDGKPIETNCFQEPFINYPTPSVPWDTLQPKPSPTKRMNNNCNIDNCAKIQTNQRDAHVQVNIPEKRTGPKEELLSYFNPFLVLPCPNRSVETQCNPNSFNTVCFSNIEQLRIVSNNKDQLVQCACADTKTNAKGLDNEHVIPMKTCHSPLVIISVYPKQDQQGDIEDDTNQKSKGKVQKNTRRTSKPLNNSPLHNSPLNNSPLTSPTESREKSPAKSRSPSPSRARKTKGEAKGDFQNKTGKARTKKETVGGQVTISNTRKEKVTQETKVSKGGKKNVKIAHSRPVAMKEAKVQANLPNDEPDSLPRLKDRGNAKPGQHHLAAFVNKNMTMRWVSAGDEPSNDIISIEVAHDHSDVESHESQLSTDSQVLEDSKEQGTDSLENFLLVHEHDGQRKRSFSQTYIFNDQQTVDTNLAYDSDLPAVSVRDSFEVENRSKEEVNGEGSETSSSSYSFRCSESTNNRNNLSPIKHYRGDCCDLFNPVERDKEIRELLGIKKHRPPPTLTLSNTKQDNNTTKGPNIAEDHSLRCLFYMKQRHRHTPPPPVCRRKSDVYTADCKQKTSCNQLKTLTVPSLSSCKCDKCSTPCKKQYLACDCKKYKTCPTATEYGIYCNDFTPNCPIEVDCPDDDECAEDGCIFDSECDYDDDYFEIDIISSEEACCTEPKEQCKCYKIGECIKACKKENPTCLPNDEADCWKGNPNKITSPCQNPVCKRRQNAETQCLNRSEQHHKGNNCCSLKTVNPLYQQLILNRNVNIYLQIEQFTKQKPIILSRKQYDKVKRTIENACFLKNKLKRIGKDRCCSNINLSKTCKKSNSSKCEIRKTEECCKKKRDITLCDLKKAIKERIKECDNLNKMMSRISDKGTCIKESIIPIVTRCGKTLARTIAAGDSYEYVYRKTTPIICRPSLEFKSKRICNMASVACQGDVTKEVIQHQHGIEQLIQIKDYEDCNVKIERKNCKNKGCCCRICKPMVGVHCCKTCEMEAENRSNKKGYKTCYRVSNRSLRGNRNASTTEVHYASVTLTKTKRVMFSTTDLEQKEHRPSVASILRQNYQTDSLHTIFKGHRKLPTPNLGTSAYSLLSEVSVDSSRSKETVSEKPRKPFLKRLMSYIVMRSKTSAVKIGRPIPNIESVDSSIDSYHISTSLGAIELSSSIYDTSASFYSDHSIRPISSKMKRGFINSVKGFISNRRN